MRVLAGEGTKTKHTVVIFLCVNSILVVSSLTVASADKNSSFSSTKVPGFSSFLSPRQLLKQSVHVPLFFLGVRNGLGWEFLPKYVWVKSGVKKWG